MDKCGICQKPASQLFETGTDVLYACCKCQPLTCEVTIDDNADQHVPVSLIEDANVEDGQLYCDICHKTFQKYIQLQNHLRNHRAERRFICTYCDKAFSQSNNLRAHLRIHTNERPYKCQQCGKAFTQVTNLNNHVRLHTGERPYVCSEPGCNKAYAQVTNLNQHRKRHLNGRGLEGTYVCPDCGDHFRQRNHLFSHRRIAHSDMKRVLSPMTLHMCKLCDRAFASEGLLQFHLQEHDSVTSQPQDKSGSVVEVSDGGGTYACVFSVCSMRFSSPHEHTEHLLQAHQLRVRSAHSYGHEPARRGRPRKTSRTVPVHQDPLALNPKQNGDAYHEAKTSKEFRFPKLNVQSLFQ